MWAAPRPTPAQHPKEVNLAGNVERLHHWRLDYLLVCRSKWTHSDCDNPTMGVCMTPTRVAIPLHGKMALRSFHCADFLSALNGERTEPIYFLGPHYYQVVSEPANRYRRLNTEAYDRAQTSGRYLHLVSNSIRNYATNSTTTDLRFRETIESMVYTTSIPKLLAYASAVEILRHTPGMDRLCCWWENRCNSVSVHREDLKSLFIDRVLTPGYGSRGFEYEGNFAREAQKLGLPVITAITNYDNIVNRGFRGFMPDCLAVWSKLMADDAIRLQKIPAAKIQITGPVQFDRFCRPLTITRDDFFRRINLDPSKKTILFAGGVNITRYFEIYQMLVARKVLGDNSPNLIVRPYPHPKLLLSPGWQLLQDLFSRCPHVSISFPPANSADEVVKETHVRDLFETEGDDELHCLLRYSDVMINIYSTISLEAAICDLPVIHLGYDLHTYGHRFPVLAGFLAQQTHNQRKARLAASKVAGNEDDLRIYLLQYLNDRGLDKQARYDYAVSECGELDGRSSLRLATLIRGARVP